MMIRLRALLVYSTRFLTGTLESWQDSSLNSRRIFCLPAGRRDHVNSAVKPYQGSVLTLLEANELFISKVVLRANRRIR